MQIDVGHRQRRPGGQRPQQLEVLAGEGPTLAADGDQAVGGTVGDHLAEGDRGDLHIAVGGLPDPVVLQGPPLGFEDRVVEAGEAADARRLGQRIPGAGADAHPAPVGPGGVDRRPQ